MRPSKTSLLFVFVLAACLGASAADLSAPRPLPGLTKSFSAAGKQEKPQIAKGGETSLAVWADTRSALVASGTLSVGGGGPYSGPGLGTMSDIYAARLDANGKVIDQKALVISQASYNQGSPQVAWDGQNWLVVWYQELENDYFNYQMRGVRVSAAGRVLDAIPLTIGAVSNNQGRVPASLLFDGSNWVVFWEDFNAARTARSVYASRIAPDGTVLDPLGLAVYNHSNQNLTSPDVAFNGSFLLVFVDLGNQALYGVRLLPNLTATGAAFPINTFQPSLPNKPQIAANGSNYLVVWDEHPFSGNVGSVTGSRVSASGQVLDPQGLIIDENVGVSESFPNLTWNGANWFVAYGSGFNEPSNNYTLQTVNIRRVSSAGAVLDSSPIRLTSPKINTLSPAISTGFNNGVHVVWNDLRAAGDIYAAQVSAGGIAGRQVAASLGAPRESRPRQAFGGGVFLSVFQAEISGASNVFCQRLDATGAALDAEPTLLSRGSNQTNRNPAVAFNGSNFLVVWNQDETDRFGNVVSKVYGTRVSASGALVGSAFYIMDGTTADVAALGDTFLTVAIRPVGSQIRNVEATRVSGAGVVLGAPASILSGNFCFAPRVAAFGSRWLAVWEYHSRHDTSISSIRASFVTAPGVVAPSFEISISDSPFGTGNSFDDTPHLAVAGNEALIVWADNDTNENNIKGRLIQADGALLGSNFGFLVSSAPGSQFSPAVTWDGTQYLATWLDHRDEQFPTQPRGDIYAARVSVGGTVLEGFPVANSAAPEETPFVASGNGLTIFSYTSFYSGAPFSALHLTMRTASSLP